MSCTTPSINGDSDGCFQTILRSIIPGTYYTWCIVQTGGVSSHKCVRTSGSKISPIEIHQKWGSKNYTLSDRQYNSIEAFDKYGRCKIFVNDQIKERDMGLSSVTCDHNYQRILSKQTEYNCRHGIQGEGRFFIVVTQPKGVSRVSSINGEPSSIFICIFTKSSITPVLSLETRSIQSGHRCSASGLVSGLPVSFCPLLPYKQNFTKGRARKNAKHVNDNTNTSHSTLVSILSSNVNRNTSYPPKDKQSSRTSFGERASLDHQRDSEVSGMENLSERLSLSEFWQEVHLQKIMNQPAENGLADVVGDKLIQFYVI